MPVDLTALKVGSYIQYTDPHVEHFGIVSATQLRVQILDENNKTQTVDGVGVQLWWTDGAGRPHLVREDTVPLAAIKAVLGERELPKLVVKQKKAALAPQRPEGYKGCDRKGCGKVVFRVVRTQTLRRTIEGFRWGNIESGDGLVLVALCSEHYRQRDGYGVIGETWQDWPKPVPVI